MDKSRQIVNKECAEEGLTGSVHVNDVDLERPEVTAWRNGRYAGQLWRIAVAPLHEAPVMAWTWRAVVLCWCLVCATSADGPARVQEVLDEPATPSQSVPDEPSSGSQQFLTVQSEDYSLQGSQGLEWLAAVTAQRGFKVDGISSKCLADMNVYWSGLASGAPWAAKSKINQQIICTVGI